MVPSEQPSPPPAPLRRTRLLVVISLTLLLAAALMPVATAQSDEQLRSEIERLQEERRELDGRKDELRQEQQQLSTELQEVTERVDALTAELAQLQDRAESMRADVAALEDEAARDRARLGERLNALYKGSAANDLLGLLAGASPTELTERGHYLSLLARKDRQGLEALAASTVALNGRREQLAATTARIDEVAQETKAAQAELDGKLAAAAEQAQEVATAIAQRDTGIAERQQELVRREEERRRKAEEERRRREEERRRKAEEARRRAVAEAERKAAEAREAEEARRRAAAEEERRRQVASRARAAEAAEEESAPAPARAPAPAPAAPSSGGMACPQDHPRSFTDTWGAPRGGGRTHKGTDVFGARGGNVFAIVDGVIQSTKSGNRSGLFLILRGNDGNAYWYLHLQDFVASPGQRVSAGDLIAHNGDTGNARGTTPHIHFELHPGGGGAVNPYSILRRACG